MLIVFAPVLLIGTAVSLGVLRVLRPRFRFMWLASFGVAWVAWISILLWQPQLPMSLAFESWGSTVAFPTAPALSANTLSWASSFGLVSVLAASLVMAPARPDFRNSLGWAVSLAIAGLALLAVAADNLLTIVLAWAALDLAEVSLTLRWANDRDSRNRAVAAFSVRAASLALVLLAMALGSAAESAGSDGLLFMSAVALRLLALPAQLASSSAAYVRNGVGVTLPLASAAATLAPLSRIQLAGSSSPFLAVLLLLTAGIALFSGWMWVRSPDDLTGQAFLMLGLSSLAMASALQANPVGANGWGVSLVLAGGALFLSGARQTRLNRAVLIGGWSLSALPFSISGAAWGYQAGAILWVLPAFVLAQALLLAGFLHHATRVSVQPSLDSQPAWLRGMFLAGLGFVLLMQLILGFWGWAGARQTQSWPAGLIATALGLVIFWGRTRFKLANLGIGERMERLRSAFVRLVTATLRGAYQASQQLVFGLTSLLEGDAGIMWGLLLLALFVSLIVGGNP